MEVAAPQKEKEEEQRVGFGRACEREADGGQAFAAGCVGPQAAEGEEPKVELDVGGVKGEGEREGRDEENGAEGDAGRPAQVAAMKLAGEEENRCARDDCGGEKVGEDGMGSGEGEQPVEDVAGCRVGEEEGNTEVGERVDEVGVGGVVEEIAEERDGGDEGRVVGEAEVEDVVADRVEGGAGGGESQQAQGEEAEGPGEELSGGREGRHSIEYTRSIWTSAGSRWDRGSLREVALSSGFGAHFLCRCGKMLL
jgi:hypothetical protein